MHLGGFSGCDPRFQDTYVFVLEEDSMRLSMVRSYGNSDSAVERRYGFFMHIAVLMFALMTIATSASAQAQPAAKPIKLVVLGDSFSRVKDETAGRT